MYIYIRVYSIYIYIYVWLWVTNEFVWKQDTRTVPWFIMISSIKLAIGGIPHVRTNPNPYIMRWQIKPIMFPSSSQKNVAMIYSPIPQYGLLTGGYLPKCSIPTLSPLHYILVISPLYNHFSWLSWRPCKRKITSYIPSYCAILPWYSHIHLYTPMMFPYITMIYPPVN
jgi:hypothetical protein